MSHKYYYFVTNCDLTANMKKVYQNVERTESVVRYAIRKNNALMIFNYYKKISNDKLRLGRKILKHKKDIN